MSRIEQSKSVVFSELNGVVAVAALRNFRKAAAALGVSASALSHAVATLEARLGVRLFHRTTRSVSLSEAGVRFLDRVGPALRQIGDAIERANDSRDTPSGTLRINTALAAARRVFGPVVLPFLERYPDMRVDLVTEGRLVDIVEAGFDAGIRLAESVPRDMVAVPCGPPMRYVVVGTPAYLERHRAPRSPADLLTHECIRRRMPSGAMLRWEFEKSGEPLAIDVRGRLTLDADELIVAAVLRGAGLAWVNEWSVEGLVAEGRLVRLLDDWSQWFPGLCLYYPSHRDATAGLRAFVAMLRESDLGQARSAARPQKKRAARRR